MIQAAKAPIRAADAASTDLRYGLVGGPSNPPREAPSCPPAHRTKDDAVRSIAGPRPGVIGRDDELAAGDAFLDALERASASLIIEGEPGIGKTTVWTEISSRARARNHVVLSSEPAQSETELPFAGLLDLLGGHIDLLPSLPGPQHRALEIALARADPDPDEAVRVLAASAGFLSILTLLSAESPVVVAIDDLQWLDVPTMRVVAYGARRLGSLRVGLLAAVRIPSPLDPTVPPVDLGIDVDSLRLAGLSTAGLYHVIDQRLGVSLPRHALHRIVDASGGNVIVALEMARSYASAGSEASVADLPLPEALGGLVSRRVAELPAATRLALLRSAALARPTTDIVDVRVLGPAIEAGLVSIDSDRRIRFGHPLFAHAVYSAAPPDRRADVHRWLSSRVADPEEATLHAALATSERDRKLAARLHEAAERVRRKGAPEYAAELEERAAARTPLDQPELELERRLRAAEHHERAGNIERAMSLASDVLGADAAVRARAHGLIAEIAFGNSFPTAIDLLEEAIRQPGAESGSLAKLELYLAFARMATMDLPAALPHAYRAEGLAAATGDEELLAEVLGMRVYIETTKEDRVDVDALRRSLDLENPDRESPIQLRPRLNAAVAYMLHGRLDEAERLFIELRTAIAESGEEHELPYVWNVLAFIAHLRGDRMAALAHVDEALQTATAVGSETLRGYAVGIRCLIASYAGEVDVVLADARESMAVFDQVGWGTGRWYPIKALAFLALSRDDPAEVERLVGPATTGLGSAVGFAAAAPFVEDLIDARLALGELDGAEQVIVGMAAGAAAVSPFAHVIAARGRALLESARGRHEAAVDGILEAEHAAVTLPIPSELGRTLLAKGQILRRTRRKQAAREALASARTVFEQIAMPLWVSKSDAELARVGLRRTGRFELTETEQRIAELAASGMTNRQIAAEAFVSPKTVEDVLSRVYAKLDIRSRAELGAWMARRD